MAVKAVVGPEIAPLDGLGREIQAILDLVKPRAAPNGGPAYDGYAGSAAEAYLHLRREREPSVDLCVMKHGKGDDVHWWLLDERGRVIDLTLSPADRRIRKCEPGARFSYEDGVGAMFRTGATKPSKLGAAIIELVRARE